MFRDILDEKKVIAVKHKGLDGLKELTKYKIEDYFPESQPEAPSLKKSKTKRGTGLTDPSVDTNE